MEGNKMRQAMSILKSYFQESLPKNVKPQIVFHGAEPLLNKDNVFNAIELFKDDFYFGIQTNGTNLDASDIKFLTGHKIAIGLSLDGAEKQIADATRKTYDNKSVFKQTVSLIEQLNGYDNWSVIVTITRHNYKFLKEILDFLYHKGVSCCMLNPVRCTQLSANSLKPDDETELAKCYIEALDHSYRLYLENKRKIIVANFANILLAILAPAARKLMCDISPCGGGRAFFAISANGDVFPCSEFIGLKEFKGGNIFKNKIQDILASKPFMAIKSRKIETINPCQHCAFIHFCGAPCPAEAYTNNKTLNSIGGFCNFYAEQTSYAFRLIAEDRYDAYLWDDWQKDTKLSFITSY